jgi:predicted hydrocarbon binding protein
MKNETKSQLIEIFKETRYLNDYLDINSILNEDYYSEITTIEELTERIEERIQETEVIYYSEAISILKEEDQSLTESFEIAEEFGYTLKNLNSEVLATLIVQTRLNEELYDFIKEVEDKGIFEEN